MKSFWTFLLFYLTHLFGCASDTSEVSPEKLDQLRELREYLREQYARKSEGHLGNWPSDQDCDGALWAGVARAAGLEQVQVHLGLTPEGRPTRRPGADCGPTELGMNGGAACTTSTDMQLGLILGLHAAKDLPSLELLRKYSDTHSMVMGFPAKLVSRSLMKPGTRALLARAAEQLGGQKDSWRYLDQLYAPPLTDYQLHLELLTLLLEERLGTMNKTKRAVLAFEADLNPQDAFCLALAGHPQKAADLLMNPGWQVPGYVRGPDLAPIVHKLLVIQYILDTHSKRR